MNPLLRRALEAKLEDLGVDWLRVESLAIRSSEKSIAASVWLEGESESVEVTVLYRLEGDDLVIEEIEASKLWMSKSVALFLAKRGNRLALPGGMKGKTLRLLL